MDISHVKLKLAKCFVPNMNHEHFQNILCGCRKSGLAVFYDFFNKKDNFWQNLLQTTANT